MCCRPYRRPGRRLPVVLRAGDGLLGGVCRVIDHKGRPVLRASTRALTTTLPNSVTWLFGIFSVSSRNRSGSDSTPPKRHSRHTPLLILPVGACVGARLRLRSRGATQQCLLAHGFGECTPTWARANYTLAARESARVGQKNQTLVCNVTDADVAPPSGRQAPCGQMVRTWAPLPAPARPCGAPP